MTHISEIIEDILVEWAYRVHDGMPNPKNTQHIIHLRESMEELNLPNNVIYEVIQNLINEDEDDKYSSIGYGRYKLKGKEKDSDADVYVKDDSGKIDNHIGRNPKNRLQNIVLDDDKIENGKRAVTNYEVLSRLNYVSLVKCNLETGRTHQIRVHMKHIGHTLFNDERYGGNKILKGTVYSKYKQFVENCFDMLPRQALHAKTLGLSLIHI